MKRYCHECGTGMPTIVAASYCPECGVKQARIASSLEDARRVKHRLGDYSPGALEGDEVVSKIFAGPRKSDLYILARNGFGSDLLIQAGILNAPNYDRVGPLAAFMLDYGPSSHSEALSLNRDNRQHIFDKIEKHLDKSMVRETRREMAENEIRT